MRHHGMNAGISHLLAIGSSSSLHLSSYDRDPVFISTPVPFVHSSYSDVFHLFVFRAIKLDEDWIPVFASELGTRPVISHHPSPAKPVS